MGKSAAKEVEQFLDKIKEDQLENWKSNNHYLIKRDYILGMRLDHQGINQDGTHRIWVQPCKGGKSKISGLDSGDFVARVVVTDGASPANVKQGLLMSAGEDAHDYKVDQNGITH
ncbi:MAG: hypothetical protein Q9195_007852 [Heterodermia aff. obscurata]